MHKKGAKRTAPLFIRGFFNASLSANPPGPEHRRNQNLQKTQSLSSEGAGLEPRTYGLKGQVSDFPVALNLYKSVTYGIRFLPRLCCFRLSLAVKTTVLETVLSANGQPSYHSRAFASISKTLTGFSVQKSMNAVSCSCL